MNAPSSELSLEKPLSLNDQRLESVVTALGTAARRILDLGCAEGRLLKLLLDEKQFEEIVGLDVSIRSLELRRRAPATRPAFGSSVPPHSADSWVAHLPRPAPRRLDAAALVEVIEHLDPPRLHALERTVFEFAPPRAVILTTPNREYNVTWPNVGALLKLRHPDHRFEWTRSEFRSWAERVAALHGYAVEFRPVGPVDETLGSPTQMAIFNRTA